MYPLLQLYWFLWYHNLLLAGSILYLLYDVLRRKFLAYPTLEELRTRRRSQDDADGFSKRILLSLTSSPAEHVKTLWNGMRQKMRKGDARMDPTITEALHHASPAPQIVIEDVMQDVDTTGVRTEDVPLADSDLAGPLLDLANRVADLHERIWK